MSRYVCLLAALISCLVVSSHSLEDEELEETLRALNNMYRLRRYMQGQEDLEQAGRSVEDLEQAGRSVEDQEEETRSIKDTFDCKKEGEACRSIPACCGENVCYWKNGWSMRKDGVCVECIKEGKTCQRDSQCCGSELQCDKTRYMKIDGTCERYRRKGACYRDSQCVTDCVKKWYQTEGECS